MNDEWHFMNKIIIFLVFSSFLIMGSCRPAEDARTEPDFSGELSAEEIEGGLLTPEILWKFGRPGDIRIAPDGTRITYSLTRYDYNTNMSKTDICILDLETGEPQVLTTNEGRNFSARWHPGGERIGYLSAEDGVVQLWEMDPDGGNISQVSDIEGGINSFGYSPAGDRIYFTKQVRLDKTPSEMHPDLPLTDVRIEDELMYRHWSSWHNYSYSHIFVTSYENGRLGEPKDIMDGERYDSPMPPFYSPAEIAWSSDGKIIAYTSKKMNPTEFAQSTDSDIYLYHIDTGKTNNITSENRGYDKYPVFSPDGNFLAWQSMETPGYESDKARLFVYNLNTGVKSYLTRDFEENASDFVWSDDSESIFFISGVNATYQVFSIHVPTRKISQVTTGRHNITSINMKGNTLIAEKMSMSMAGEIFRINPVTGRETQLTFINQHIYDNIAMGHVAERWVETTDGREMLVWVIYPPDFDPDKRYPALLYCQGGPQSAVSQFFSFRWNFQLMAANDYIIVAPNRRGLPTFGQQWNRQISGDWGGQAMNDYLSAIDDVKKEAYIDDTRIGAVGASFGGYSVFQLAGTHQGRFRAFISHNGVFNLESMYGATEETFFVNHDLGGAYWERPRPVSYDEFSPHLFVHNWDTPILIYTGEHDYRVPYTEGLQAFNIARLKGIPARLIHFPNEGHWVLQPQNGILWQREFFLWLDRWLKN
jgi:dipeptidyl aminopeptidase/acylaminoacyl peptidase